MSSIKRAASLYSFQDEYATRRMSLEEILAEVAATGAEGVELLSDQMIRRSPYPTRETVQQWRDLTDKYGLARVCNDIFLNSTLYHNRRLTRAEEAAQLRAELANARELGFSLVRLVSDTDAGVTESALADAERLQVCMALEVHAGMSFDNPTTAAFIDMIRRLNSPYLGLVVDMGIFSLRHPRVSTNYFRQFGLTQPMIDYIDGIFAAGSDPRTYFGHKGLSGSGEYPAEALRLVTCPADMEYLIFSSGYENTPLSVLEPHLPYTRHIHGKCFEMTEDGEEYSVDYPRVLRFLREKGWSGYIATEYEGTRFVPLDQPVDALPQIRRHQAMLHRYLSEGDCHV